MSDNSRGLLTGSLDDTAYWQKNPMIQGFIAGLKGAMLGAGAGAITNIARGAGVGKGALVGGLGLGAIMGIAKALSQEVDNTNQESALRYHLMRLSDREPMIYMPPPKIVGPLFRRLHLQAHNELPPHMEHTLTA